MIGVAPEPSELRPSGRPINQAVFVAPNAALCWRDITTLSLCPDGICCCIRDTHTVNTSVGKFGRQSGTIVLSPYPGRTVETLLRHCRLGNDHIKSHSSLSALCSTPSATILPSLTRVDLNHCSRSVSRLPTLAAIVNGQMTGLTWYGRKRPWAWT